jgi:hypothetical protein
VIIDFHTHIFPEALAAKTLPWIKSFTGIQYRVDGTGEGLKRSMEACGVDACVTMPIVTNPKTMSKINDYAAQQAAQWGFYSFGSVHPDASDWRQELKRFHELGLRGVKLHNDYQGFWFDSKECRDIIEAAYQEGLAVLVHPGNDPVSAQIHRCTPQMLRDALPLLTQGTFIAAHMGGHMMLSEAMDTIIGSDIYMDVSMISTYNSLDDCKRAILAHDPDKLLFGTDSPWDGQDEAIACIRSMNLGQELEDKLFYRNAQRLLT